jgi:hypothetical protein
MLSISANFIDYVLVNSLSLLNDQLLQYIVDVFDYISDDNHFLAI